MTWFGPRLPPILAARATLPRFWLTNDFTPTPDAPNLVLESFGGNVVVDKAIVLDADAADATSSLELISADDVVARVRA